MKKGIIYFLLLSGIVYSFFSCQKELSGDPVGNAGGNLNNDSIGNCLPMGVYGGYIVAKTLNASHYIEAPVTITKPGAYIIQTDTINGFSFKATGNFSAAGNYKVKLIGTGTPLTEGMNDFNIMFAGTTCNTTIKVEPDSSSGPAVFTVQGTPGSCLHAIVAGEYIKGVSLTNSSTVSIDVTVTKPGTYSVSTTSVNGYRFVGFGSLTATGNQTIILTATGTPLKAGTDNFTLNAIVSSCTFPVIVPEPVVVTNNDHFPLTLKSYWSYNDLVNVGDTLTRTIADSAFNIYTVMNEQYRYGGPVPYYFRRTGNDYYEYGLVDKYTRSFAFVPAIKGEILFLKENIITGDTWTSPEYTGTLNSGQPIFLQYHFTCDNDDGALTINGKSFIHVYEIVLRPQVRSATIYPYNSTGEIISLFYAKGVGLIYAKNITDGFKRLELQLRNWKVN
jgi:hypothetical protein